MRSFGALFLSTFVLPIVKKKYFTVRGDINSWVEKEYKISKRIKFDCSLAIERYQDRNFYYLNKDSSVNKTIIYVHGGGFVLNIFTSQWSFINKLVRGSNAKAIVPDYRLAPFATYLDAFNLFVPFYINYINEHPNEKIILVGDSAGGGFITSIYFELIRRNIKLPDQMILISPWLDLSGSNPDIDKYVKRDHMLTKEGLIVAGKLWSKGIDIKDDKVSPLFGDLSLIKNIVMLYGDRDILYPDGKIFANKIKDNKNVKIIFREGMNHVYPICSFKEARQDLKLIIEVINKL